MGTNRTWWIPTTTIQFLIVVTTVLALPNPMRHRPLPWRSIHLCRNHNIVPNLRPSPSPSPHRQQLYPSRRNCHFNYFTPPVSQQRQRVSSLDMSTDDNDDPPSPATATAAAADDVDTDTSDATANMIQEWEELYQSGRSSGSSSKIDAFMYVCARTINKCPVACLSLTLFFVNLFFSIGTGRNAAVYYPHTKYEWYRSIWTIRCGILRPPLMRPMMC